MLGPLDWAIVASYFLAVFGVAFWAARKEKDRHHSVDSYFLAGRHASWFVIGASLFASNIGSEHLIGLAGTGASSGFAVAQFELLASLILIGLGWFFAPVYFRLGLRTMPQFLEERYSPAARWYLATISILAYVMTKIAVTIAAGGVVFQTLMGIDFWTGATIVVVATGVYTLIGGLTAVLYTDLVQMIVLIAGSLLVTWIGLDRVGGFSGLVASTPGEYLSVWRAIDDPAFPWTGILLGAPILGIWYWCTDQFIVQRVLSARNISHAQGGTVMAGFLKLTPMFLFVLPGLIALSLQNSGALTLEKADQALPALVAHLLPVGLRGLVVAGLLAALMSSLSSVFNSCSTLISVDIWKKLRPDSSERQLVVVGQVSTGLMVILGLMWIPLIDRISSQLYQYLQSVQAYISPPIAAVFILGIATRRVCARGAMTALWFGFAVGMARLIAEIFKPAVVMESIVAGFVTMNFLHFAAMLFALSVGVAWFASVPSEAKTEIFTGGETATVLKQSPQERKMLNVLAVVLVASVALIWLVFSPIFF